MHHYDYSGPPAAKHESSIFNTDIGIDITKAVKRKTVKPLNPLLAKANTPQITPRAKIEKTSK